MSQLTKAKHSFRYHPYLYDFLNIATFLRSNVKLPQSFSTLVSGLYSPVSLLFPHNRRVAIKICLKPFHDFPISLKIKLNPLTWPNPARPHPAYLPLGPSLSYLTFHPAPAALFLFLEHEKHLSALGPLSSWILLHGMLSSPAFPPLPLKLSLNLLCQRGPSWTPNLSHYINSITSTVCIK